MENNLDLTRTLVFLDVSEPLKPTVFYAVVPSDGGWPTRNNWPPCIIKFRTQSRTF